MDKKRLSSILAEISVQAGISVARLRRELENTHGIAVSGARLAADLALLEDAGLIHLAADGAAATSRGMDVARLRAPFPDL